MRELISSLMTFIACLGIAGAQSSADYTLTPSTTASLSTNLNAVAYTMASGTTQLVGAGADDISSNSVDIGFPFWFMGTYYTKFSANSNGFIRLGGQPAIAAGYGINGGAGQSIIAAFAGDLETSSTGKIHYKLIGSAPNRCLVVEFLNMGLDFTGTYTNPDGTYQIRLYETTNSFDFVYGAMNVNSSTVNVPTNTFNIGFSTTTAVAGTFLAVTNVVSNTFSTSSFSTINPARPGAGTSPITGLTGSSDGVRKSFLFTPAMPSCSPLSSFPWTEGFESTTSTSLPSCWNRINGGDNDQWESSASGAHNGTSSVTLFTNNSNGNNDDYLILPQLTLSGNQQLKFWVRAQSFGDPNDYVVRLSTAGLLPDDFTNILLTETVSSTAHSEKIIDLSAFSGNVYIAIQVPNGGLDGLALFFDDFTIEDLPLCTVPINPTVSAISNNGAAVSFISAGNNFVVEYGLPGFTPGTAAAAGVGGTVVNGTSSPISISGLSPTTTYQVYVRQNCGVDGYSANTQAVSFTTTCAPTSLPWSDGFESIASPGEGVVPSCWSTELVSGTNITSAGSPVRNGLGARTGTKYVWAKNSSDVWLFSPGFTLTAGVSYDFSYYYRQTDPVPGFTVTTFYGNATGEAGMTTPVGVINDPVNTGYVQVKYTMVPSSSGTYYFGLHIEAADPLPWYLEFDDFVFEQTPSCITPTAVSANGLSSSTASVSFSAAGSSFIVEYGLPGFTPGTAGVAGTGGTVVTGAASPIALSLLTAGTTYQVYVRQDCGGGSYSPNSAPALFSTLCTTTTVPYLERFDNVIAPAMPACVIVENIGANAQTWKTNSTDLPASFPNLVRLDYENDGITPANDWFFTQGLSLTGGTSYRLRFHYRNSDATDYIEKLEVKYGTAANAAAMTTGTIFTNTNINFNTWTEGSVDFTPGSSAVYYLGFHGFSDADQAYLALDNVSVIATPACAPPTGISFNTITGTSALVAFNGAGSSFILEYGAVGFTPGTAASAGGGTVITGSSSPIQITGLTPQTLYDVYVRRDCGGGSFSPNSLPMTLTTGIPNDDAPGAILLTVGAACTGATYSNFGATGSVNEVYPSCSGAKQTPVWFRFVAPASGAVRVSTDAGSNTTFNDSKLGLFSATNVNDYSTFKIISCDEDGGSQTGLGLMSVLYATGLTAGQTYYVAVDKFSDITSQGSFCITVDELNLGMLATANDCLSGYEAPLGSNTDYKGWQPLMDADSKLIALVRDTLGVAVEEYTVSQNINIGAVRKDGTAVERFYLDRNFRISHSAATRAEIQFFFLDNELAALTAVDPGATELTIGATKQTETVPGCYADFAVGNGTNTYLPQTSRGVSTDGEVRWITVSSGTLSNFYLHASKAPMTVKVFLQGAYNAGLARHKNVTAAWAGTLNAGALNQPYNTAPFGNYNGAESVPGGFFAATAGTTDIIDWVLLELRDAVTPATLISRRAALVREDGEIVDVDGVTPASFRGIAAGSYHLVIRHRNHLSVRTSAVIATNGTLGQTTVNAYDFTNGQAKAFQNGAVTTNAAQASLGAGVFGMWGGNVNGNTNVRFSGLNNDFAALVAVLGGNQASTLNTYNAADLNMDGTVRFSGLNNDFAALVSFLGGIQSAVVTQH